MIAIVDYGVGNLFSLNSSLEMIGAESVVTADEVVLRSADKILLPGVAPSRMPPKSCGKAALLTSLRSWQRRESRCWASVLVCRCCLKEAMNTVSMRDWD